MLTALRPFPFRTVGAPGSNRCARSISFLAAKCRKARPLYTVSWNSRVDRDRSMFKPATALVIKRQRDPRLLPTEQCDASAAQSKKPSQAILHSEFQLRPLKRSFHCSPFPLSAPPPGPVTRERPLLTVTAHQSQRPNTP